MTTLRSFARNNGLSLAVFSLFLVFLAGESIAGFHAYNDDRKDHGQPAVSYAEFLTSGRFIEATTENWESEFLEMAFYAMLTSCLYQRGSAESKSLTEPEEVDRAPRLSKDLTGAPWPVRRASSCSPRSYGFSPFRTGRASSWAWER